MIELYTTLQKWQNVNQKRFLSLNIHLDKGIFCCIAFTNPTDVVIVASDSEYVSKYNEINCQWNYGKNQLCVG